MQVLIEKKPKQPSCVHDCVHLQCVLTEPAIFPQRALYETERPNGPPLDNLTGGGETSSRRLLNHSALSAGTQEVLSRTRCPTFVRR